MQPNRDKSSGAVDTSEMKPTSRATVDTTRGQTGLFALVDGAYRSSDREPAQRHVATSLAEMLVSETAEHTTRANVVNSTEIHTLTEERIDHRYPFTRTTAVRIRLGNETIVERGDPTGGTTVRRLVLREHRRQVTQPVRETPTIPSGSQRATITIPPNESVTTVRANDRVVLHDPDGLTGSFEVRLTDIAPTQVRIEGETGGTATVTYTQVRTTPTELVVTVDA